MKLNNIFLTLAAISLGSQTALAHTYPKLEEHHVQPELTNEANVIHCSTTETQASLGGRETIVVEKPDSCHSHDEHTVDADKEDGQEAIKQQIKSKF